MIDVEWNNYCKNHLVLCFSLRVRCNIWTATWNISEAAARVVPQPVCCGFVMHLCQFLDIVLLFFDFLSERQVFADTVEVPGIDHSESHHGLVGNSFQST